MKKYILKKRLVQKIFTTALFKTVKSWKEPNYPSLTRKSGQIVVQNS